MWLDDNHVLLVAQHLSSQPDGTTAQPSRSADELLVVNLADGSVQSGKLCPGKLLVSAAGVGKTPMRSCACWPSGTILCTQQRDNGMETMSSVLQRCSCPHGSRCCGQCRRRLLLQRCCSCRTVHWRSSVTGPWCGWRAAASRRPARSWPAYQPAQQVGTRLPVVCTGTWQPSADRRSHAGALLGNCTVQYSCKKECDQACYT